MFPAPPVSPPPSDAPHSGSVGAQYGIQSFARWAAGDTQEKQVVDAIRAVSLWRVSVFGDVLVRVDYGTAKNRSLVGLQAPFVMNLPGQAQVYAKPADADHDGVLCAVTLTAATSGAEEHARKVIDAGAGPSVALDTDAVRFVALEASTLTISGISTSVPALATVPLVAGAVLNTGSGYQEFVG